MEKKTTKKYLKPNFTIRQVLVPDKEALK